MKSAVIERSSWAAKVSLIDVPTTSTMLTMARPIISADALGRRALGVAVLPLSQSPGHALDGGQRSADELCGRLGEEGAQPGHAQEDEDGAATDRRQRDGRPLLDEQAAGQ